MKRIRYLLISSLLVLVLTGCSVGKSNFKKGIELEVDSYLTNGENYSFDEYRDLLFSDEIDKDNLYIHAIDVKTDIESYKSGKKLYGSVTYSIKDKQFKDHFQYKLVDKTPPTIEVVRPLLRKHDEFTLQSLIKVSDNSTKEELSNDKVQIKGSVDVKKEGVYQLEVYAQDDAGNESHQEVEIEVIK